MTKLRSTRNLVRFWCSQKLLFLLLSPSLYCRGLCACAAVQDAVTVGYSHCTMVTEVRHSAYQSPVCPQTPILLTTELHSRCATCARVYRCAWMPTHFRPGLIFSVLAYMGYWRVSKLISPEEIGRLKELGCECSTTWIIPFQHSFITLIFLSRSLKEFNQRVLLLLFRELLSQCTYCVMKAKTLMHWS